jgi:hypothetical protein
MASQRTYDIPLALLGRMRQKVLANGFVSVGAVTIVAPIWDPNGLGMYLLRPSGLLSGKQEIVLPDFP